MRWPTPVSRRCSRAARIAENATYPLNGSSTPRSQPRAVGLVTEVAVAHARHRLDRPFDRRKVTQWSGLAKAADRAVDQARIERLQRRPRDAQLVGHTRSKVFDEHVRPLHQAQQRRPVRVALEIEHHRALARVQRDERRRSLAKIVAAGRLHLHDVRAQQLKLLRAKRPGERVRQVHHAHPRQRLRHSWRLYTAPCARSASISSSA